MEGKLASFFYSKPLKFGKVLLWNASAHGKDYFYWFLTAIEQVLL